MYNGVWIKKPWFWTERFLLAHPYWMSFSSQLWMPLPRFVGRFITHRRIVKMQQHAKEQYKRLGWDKFDK